MGYVVRMPQLGMTMEEGIVAAWAVEEGDPIEADELVAVIESEKTTNDLEAREDGVLLEQFIDLDVPVEPGTPIGYIGAADESVPDEVRAEVPQFDATEPATDEPLLNKSAPTTESSPLAAALDEPAAEFRISPRARSAAADAGVDPATFEHLDGSGPGGAIIEEDVLSALDQGVVPTTPAPSIPIVEERPSTGLRGAVATQMSAAATIPQVTLNRSANIEAVLEHKAALEENTGLAVSIEDFVVAAVSAALAEHPTFNAHYQDGVLHIAEESNIGVAVDVDRGLLTPVIENTGQKSLGELAAARRERVDAVLKGAYEESDLQGGTFTITNLGLFGIDSFDPLLNVPEVAILGVNTIEPRLTGDGTETAPHLGLSLTFDHRPNDGADAARFLDTIITGLESPETLTEDVSARDVSAQSTSEYLEGPRRSRAVSTDGMYADIQSRGFTWSADEPEDVGGTDAAPTPVEQFLGSLASCLTLFIRTIADRRDTDISTITVDISASPDHDAIEALAVDVTVVSPEDDQTVESVVHTAERACYVNRLVTDDIEQSISVTVESP